MAVGARRTAVVQEMEREAGIAPPTRTIREPNAGRRASRPAACSGCSCSSRSPPSSSTTSARATSSQTSLKVALAVVADGGAVGRRQPPVRPGLRPLDPLQHHRRCRARLRRLLRRRVERLAQDARRQAGAALRLRACSTRSPDGRTRPFDVNSLLWGLIGGAALGLVMFLLSAPRQQLARFPLAVVGFTGFGLLTAFALDDSVWPALDWGKLLICAGGRRGGVRADRPLALRAGRGPALGPHRDRRRLARRRVGRRRHRRWQLR